MMKKVKTEVSDETPSGTMVTANIGDGTWITGKLCGEPSSSSSSSDRCVKTPLWTRAFFYQDMKLIK